MDSIFFPLLGGLLIGVSTSLMLWGLGRITGISGIYSSVLTPSKEHFWKYSFLLGLLAGGIVMKLAFSESFFSYEIKGSVLQIVIAGLLVGLGTRLGNGCTSGHGVCGVSRMAKRSLVATFSFIVVGMIVVGLKGVL